MGNELMAVEFESISGITVKLDAATVRNTLTRGNGKITDQEVAMFLRTCQAKKLDPLENGEVWLIKYDDKAPASMVVGYHAYVRRAERNPDYRGYKAGVVVIRKGKEEPVYKEGSAVYKQIGETLIGGWCKVYRAFGDRIDETYAEVSLDEYSTGKSNWNVKPATMIRKCAIAQAFRGAFPNDYEGLYTEDEMIASGAIPSTFETTDSNGKVVEVIEDQIITQEERQEFLRAISENFEGPDKRNEVYCAVLKELGLKASTKMKKAFEIINRLASEEAEVEYVDPDEPEDEEPEAVEETE